MWCTNSIINNEEKTLTVSPAQGATGETARSVQFAEAKNTMENTQEESVVYNKFYSDFTPRALNTIGIHFDLIQRKFDDYYTIQSEIGNIRLFAEYIDMLQKMFSLVQQMEGIDKKEKKND